MQNHLLSEKKCAKTQYIIGPGKFKIVEIFAKFSKHTDQKSMKKILRKPLDLLNNELTPIRVQKSRDK